MHWAETLGLEYGQRPCQQYTVARDFLGSPQASGRGEHSLSYGIIEGKPGGLFSSLFVSCKEVRPGVVAFTLRANSGSNSIC